MLLLFMIVLFVLLYFEYKTYNSFITPFCVIGGVYFAFVPINNLIGTKFGNYLITNHTMLLFLLYLYILFSSGFLFRTLQKTFQKKDINQRQMLNIKLNESYSEKIINKEKIIFLLFIVGVISYGISLIQVISIYGINDTKSRSFGVFAHIGFLAKALVPFMLYYYTQTKNKKYIFSISIFLVILIMFQGKYNVFIALLSLVFFSLNLKNKLNYIRITLIVFGLFLSGMMAFILNYTIIPNIINGVYNLQATLLGIEFSIKHFFHYLFSPFITSNDYFEMPAVAGLENGLRTVFNPFDTLYQQFSGKRDFFAPVVNVWPEVSNDGATANIGGIFSESVLNIGYLYAGLYVYLLGVVIYFFYFMFSNYRKYVGSSAYLLALIGLSFFCNFFTLLTNFEAFIYLFIVEFFVIEHNFVPLQKKKAEIPQQHNYRRHAT